MRDDWKRPLQQLFVLMMAMGVCLAWTISVAAQDTPPPYPRRSLAKWYKVDPSWPQRPDIVNWGQMPGVAVDEEDNVWLYTRATPPVQVYTSEGKYITGWGEDLIGKAHHMKFDSRGHVWLADVENHVVMQLTKKGQLLKTLGTRGVPGEDETHLNKPTDMAISPTGEVFVSDGYGNNRIVHFDAEGNFVKAWGKLGTRRGQFSIPHAIAMDSQGTLYVADRNNVRVQLFDQEGEFLRQWANVITPWGFWITKDDQIWVCGSSPMPWRDEDEVLGCPPKDQLFMRFNTNGRMLQLWTIPKGDDGKEQPGECNWVHSIALDSNGNVYLGDIIGQRAQKFVPQN